MLSKERELFKNISNERLNRIEELTKNINYDELNFFVQNRGDENNFTRVEDPVVFLNDIKTGKFKIEEAKNLQEDFNKLIKNNRKGNKSEKQKIG